MLPDDELHGPQTMMAALLQLANQAPPSKVVIPGLLDGMASVNRLARRWLKPPARPLTRSTAHENNYDKRTLQAACYRYKTANSAPVKRTRIGTFNS